MTDLCAKSESHRSVSEWSPSDVDSGNLSVHGSCNRPQNGQERVAGSRQYHLLVTSGVARSCVTGGGILTCYSLPMSGVRVGLLGADLLGDLGGVE